MSKDDMCVIVYKLLSYIYECIKSGVEPNLDKAYEVSGAPNNVYWLAVINEVVDKGFVRGVAVSEYISGTEIEFNHAALTLDGVQFLEENSTMAKVANALGSPFVGVVQKAVKATALL